MVILNHYINFWSGDALNKDTPVSPQTPKNQNPQLPKTKTNNRHSKLILLLTRFPAQNKNKIQTNSEVPTINFKKSDQNLTNQTDIETFFYDFQIFFKTIKYRLLVLQNYYRE